MASIQAKLDIDIACLDNSISNLTPHEFQHPLGMDGQDVTTAAKKMRKEQACTRRLWMSCNDVACGDAFGTDITTDDAPSCLHQNRIESSHCDVPTASPAWESAWSAFADSSQVAISAMVVEEPLTILSNRWCLSLKESSTCPG